MDRVSGTSFFGCSAGWFGAGAALPPASAGFSFAASPFASSPPVGAAYLFPPLVPPDEPPQPASPAATASPATRRPAATLVPFMCPPGIGRRVECAVPRTPGAQGAVPASGHDSANGRPRNAPDEVLA